MNPIIKKNGLNYGLALGLWSILTASLVYAFSLYSSWASGLIILAINIVVLVFLMINTKKQLGGIMTFKQGFTVYFLAIFIMLLVGTVYNIVLYNVIDPEAKEVLKEETIKTTVSTMESFGAPATEINKAVDRMQEEDSLSPGKQFMSFGFSLGFAAVIGLIFALIFKSREVYKE